MVRTIIEAAFLWLQFYLFGFEVPMVYNCHARPCPTVTECWVSRAYEKTIFLYFMFIIGKCSITIVYKQNPMNSTAIHTEQYRSNLTKCSVISDLIDSNIFLGSASFLLGILEFWSLGWVRLRVALGCNTRTKFQKKSGRKPSLTRIEHCKYFVFKLRLLQTVYPDGVSGQSTVLVDTFSFVSMSS